MPPHGEATEIKIRSATNLTPTLTGHITATPDDDAGFVGWRRNRGEASMSDVHRTVRVNRSSSKFRRALSFFGPGYLIAVGYMDPGNWATSLAGGSRFGYTLLSVVLISNLMAVLLQALCTRLAVATERDLAQACRDAYPNFLAWPLWLLAEFAICATDLAEVIGTAIGLNLLFGIPLELGVIITAADVLLVLYLQNKGFRRIEALIITLLGVIALCFFIQILMAQPDWGDVIRGFAPTSEILKKPDMLYIALGIIGATVMPHNLYLHSAIVQTRDYGHTVEEKHEAIRFATLDSTIALTLALIVNASILILAAASFNATGHVGVDDLNEAHTLLNPLLGSSLAPTLFAVALLCCGLNSTITATMAGQIVMEGFINIRLTPWLRRAITRFIAIVPAAIVTMLYGSQGTAELLILSQVVLSLQLPFAIIPLVIFTANKRKMGVFVAARWLTTLAAIIAIIIVVLNMKLIYDFMNGIPI